MIVFTKLYWLLRIGVDKSDDKNLRKKFKYTAHTISWRFNVLSEYDGYEQLKFRNELKDAKSLREALLDLFGKFLKKKEIK